MVASVRKHTNTEKNYPGAPIRGWMLTHSFICTRAWRRSGKKSPLFHESNCTDLCIGSQPLVATVIYDSYTASAFKNLLG